MDTAAVSPRDLYQRLQTGESVSILDIRNRDEYERWQIQAPTAKTVQVSQARVLSAHLQSELPTLLAEHDLSEPLVVVCARGEASDEIAAEFRDVGIRAVNLTGGMDAWGSLLIDRRVSGVDGLVQFERPSSGCLSYLVINQGEAALVDPLRAFVDRYLTEIETHDLSLRWVVDTHLHADHVSGLRDIATMTGATPVLPEGVTDRGIVYEVRKLADQEALPLGERELRGVHAPGHTSELFIFEWGDALLTADALFVDGVGRPDLEADDDRTSDFATRLYDTLTTDILQRGDDTLIAPGHASTGVPRRQDGTIVDTLEAVRDRLRLSDSSEEAFVQRMTSDQSPRPANYRRIIDVNRGTEEVDGDTAAELELGPNNCAVAMDH